MRDMFSRMIAWLGRCATRVGKGTRAMVAGLRGFMARRGLIVLGLFVPLLFFDLGYGLWEASYSPNFCNVCHVIRPYVTSYQTSEHLDHLHGDASVVCKDCHHVKPTETFGEIWAYVTSDYKQPFPEADFSQEDCLACHRSYQSLKERTSALEPNPHDPPHYEALECAECHKVHRESVLFCDSCHQWELETR